MALIRLQPSVTHDLDLLGANCSPFSEIPCKLEVFVPSVTAKSVESAVLNRLA